MLTTAQNGNGVGLTSDAASGNQSIDGILNGTSWASNTLTDSFPTASADYGSGQGTGNGQYNDPAPFNNLTQLSSQDQAEVQRALALISSYTNLTFTQINETTTTHADLRLADSSSPSTSYSYNPA